MAWEEGSATRRFNRLCRTIAFLWLIIILPLSFLHSPTYQDFSALYTGGLIVQTGDWNALYPDKIGNGQYYIGEPGQDQEKPSLVQIANPRGMKEWCAFLNPPWQAIPLWPLAWMNFSHAHWAFVIFSILCMYGVAWAAGRSYELCARRASRTAGVLTLIAACSPLAYRAIRVGNLSPPVAFCVVIIIWDFLGKTGRSGFLAGLAAAWGALMKLATVPLFPLALVTRRWKMIFWAIAFFLLDILIAWHLAGSATFHEFFNGIAPSLSRSSINPGNKSLQGFLLRITHQSPLPPIISSGFHLLQWLTFALVLYLVLWPRNENKFWSQPRHVLAGAVALLAWLLIFSPLCWDHYFLYLCPFWGWLVWEGSLSPIRTLLAIAAIAMNWFPLPVLRWLRIPEPINSYMLLGLIIMFIFAIVRLSSTQSSDSLRITQA
ncbi:MAG TPA: glycosyltransferase family 87 protein [Tepidisphaeraceae bacterium]|jgi:hypothetical protein